MPGCCGRRVQKTKKHGSESAFGHSTCKWNHELETSSPIAVFQQKLRKLTNSHFYQVFVMLIIGLDFGLTIQSLVVSGPESSAMAIVNFVILSIFTFDILFRITAEGRDFLKPESVKMNLFEVLIVFLCLIFQFLDTGISPSLGRSVRPIFRGVKAVRLMSKAALAKGRIGARFDQMVDNMADSIVQKMLGDVLLVPPKNMKVSAHDGLVRLEKSQLIPEAFADIHLPFTIKGGFIELVHIDFDLKGKGHEGVVICIKNVAFVVGPGHHQIPPAPPWNFYSVAAAKGKLIELMSRRLEGTEKKPDENEEEEQEEKQKGSMAKRYVARIKERIRRSLREQVYVEIRNIMVRYEDPDPQLHTSKILGGMKLGRLNASLAGNEHWKGVDESSDFRAMGTRRLSCDDLGAEGGKKVSDSVRLNISMSRISAWWDLDPKVAFFTPLLKDPKEIAKAISAHGRADMRQCIRVAALRELCRLHEVKTGMKFPINRFVKLQQMFANHKYLVHPVNASVHFLFCDVPSKNRMQEDGRHIVTRDVDIAVKNLTFEAGMRRVASVKGLAMYFEQWQREERCYQWRPPREPNMPCADPLVDMDMHSSVSTKCEHHASHFSAQKEHVRRWWLYALQGVLRWIDPKVTWHVLFFAAVQGRHRKRARYIKLMCLRYEAVAQVKRSRIQKMKHQETEIQWNDELEFEVEELQVALPVPEILLYRRSAREILAEKQGRLRLRTTGTASVAIPPTAAQTEEFRVGDVEETATPDKVAESVIGCQSVGTAADFRAMGKATESGSMQIHVRIERAAGVILELPSREFNSSQDKKDVKQVVRQATGVNAGPPKPQVRIPVVQLTLSKIAVTLYKDPDRKMTNNGHGQGFHDPFGEMCIEAQVQEFNTLHCEAPSSAPLLRHVVRRKPAEKQRPESSPSARAGCGNSSITHSLQPMLRCFMERQLPPAPTDSRGEAHERALRLSPHQWVFQLDLSSINIVIYKPLWSGLAAGLTPEPLLSYSQATAVAPQLDADGDGIPNDALSLPARNAHHEAMRRTRKNWSDLQAGTKIRFPGSDKVAMSTVCNDDLEVVVIEPATQQRYLVRHHKMPASIFEISQCSQHPRVNAACVFNMPADVLETEYKSSMDGDFIPVRQRTASHIAHDESLHSIVENPSQEMNLEVSEDLNKTNAGVSPRPSTLVPSPRTSPQVPLLTAKPTTNGTGMKSWLGGRVGGLIDIIMCNCSAEPVPCMDKSPSSSSSCMEAKAVPRSIIDRDQEADPNYAAIVESSEGLSSPRAAPIQISELYESSAAQVTYNIVTAASLGLNHPSPPLLPSSR